MNELLFIPEQDGEAGVEDILNPLAPGEILLGTLSSIDSAGIPEVNFIGVNAAMSTAALSTVPIVSQHIGRQVALLFANGDIQKPIIIGLIHSPLNAMLESFSLLQDIEMSPVPDVANNALDGAEEKNPFGEQETVALENTLASQAMRVDGKRIVIEGQEEIALTCGESSITLTKAGKIIIRGKYLVSRSSGVNRILGGSVQVN